MQNTFCAKSELRAAYEAAQHCGARIVLGDRDYRVTHKRVHGPNEKAPRTYGSKESLYDFLHKEHALLDYLIGIVAFPRHLLYCAGLDVWGIR